QALYAAPSDQTWIARPGTHQINPAANFRIRHTTGFPAASATNLRARGAIGRMNSLATALDRKVNWCFAALDDRIVENSGWSYPCSTSGAAYKFVADRAMSATRATDQKHAAAPAVAPQGPPVSANLRRRLQSWYT